MFCIMRTEKRKRTDLGGIQRENTRTATEYNNRVNPGMDVFNVTLKESSNWLQDIDNEIRAAGAKSRSNSVLALDTIYTASPQFFQERTNAENDQFFQDCLKFHNEHFGHIISAVVHYDETTPHLHVISVPLTKDGRLSARDVIGNKAKMTKTQDQFFEQVGRGYGLERGVHMDGQEKRQHISAQEHELREIKQAIARGKEELEAIEHSEETARTRAQTAKQTATELQKEVKQLQEEVKQLQEEVKQLQEERNSQHKSLLKLTEAKYKTQKEVKKLNYTINDKQTEFDAITADIKQASENLEEISGYLSKAEQNRAQEIANRWDDWEEDFTL
jgi:peptidoglycan hydrolase CwlO-like protein